MKSFHINRPDEKIIPALQTKIDNLAKPKGSLGTLEKIALHVGWIQQTLTPSLHHPHNVLFAGDHGITDEGVSLSPKAVTWQQTLHFFQGGTAIAFLCHQHGFVLDVVDAGVDYDFPKDSGIIDKKVRKGTNNFLHEAAMSEEEMDLCLTRGAEVVEAVHSQGCNIVSFGEMGIGNTSPSSVWMSYFTGIPLEQCVGAGSGLDNEGIRHKYNILKRSMNNYKGNGTAADIIRYFGGFEMVMTIGGMLKAAELGMTILIDGFIMTNCLLAAKQLYPEVVSYAIFGHQGDEAGHKLVLEALGAHPILHLGMRLGEGTGAVCSYPIIDSAMRMMSELDLFQDTVINKYFK